LPDTIAARECRAMPASSEEVTIPERGAIRGGEGLYQSG